MASSPAAFALSPAATRRLRGALLAWYQDHRRDLPWRGTRDPYAILVSEFMLQQTQVATVLPYFERFLARFPTFEHLARAGEESVRASWSGLGYYRRARNLQATAALVVREHGGKLPSDLRALRALPGVGDYTAAALASLIHDVPKAVLDGNVIRVLARLAAVKAPVSRAETRHALQELADALLDPSAAGDWNQGMMELGATVCTPRSPRCPECPLGFACRALTEGRPERFPPKDASRPAVTMERAVGVFRRGPAVLLVRRSDPRLLDGTWELPGVDLVEGARPRAALARHLSSWLGRPVRVGCEVARVQHAITHRRITLRGFEAQAHPLPRAAVARRWVTQEGLSELATSSMTPKVIAKLR